jgi:hypothetical protein
MSPRTGRALAAAILALLWVAGSLWRSQSLDVQTDVTAVVIGGLAGLLMFWVLDKFSSFRL